MIQFRDVKGVEPLKLKQWIDHLDKNLRQQDRDECSASSFVLPRESMMVGAMVSTHCWVITADDVPVCIFGCVQYDDTSATMWMLGTDEMNSRRVAFRIAAKTKHYCDLMNASHPVLFNYIDERNTASLRWLKWAGFEILDFVPDYGVERRPFYLFARGGTDV